MTPSYSDWPVAVKPVSRDKAEKAYTGVVGIPNPGQVVEWQQQVEEEEPELPFVDDGES